MYLWHQTNVLYRGCSEQNLDQKLWWQKDLAQDKASLLTTTEQKAGLLVEPELTISRKKLIDIVGYD